MKYVDVVYGKSDKKSKLDIIYWNKANTYKSRARLTILNDLEWLRMTFNDLKWLKMTKNDLKWLKNLMTKNDLKWLKMT